MNSSLSLLEISVWACLFVWLFVCFVHRDRRIHIIWLSYYYNTCVVLVFVKRNSLAGVCNFIFIISCYLQCNVMCIPDIYFHTDFWIYAPSSYYDNHDMLPACLYAWSISSLIDMLPAYRHAGSISCTRGCVVIIIWTWSINSKICVKIYVWNTHDITLQVAGNEENEIAHASQGVSLDKHKYNTSVVVVR